MYAPPHKQAHMHVHVIMMSMKRGGGEGRAPHLASLTKHMDTIGEGVVIEGWLMLHMEYIFFHNAFSDVVVLHLLIPLPVDLSLHMLNGSLSLCCCCVLCLCNGQHEQRGKLKPRLVSYWWELMLIELILSQLALEGVSNSK
jgi:hypothetical protein